MFDSQRCIAFRHRCLLFTCLMWAGFAAPLYMQAQTTQAVNYNPNNFDAHKIVQAFQQHYSDLTLLSAHRGIHAVENTDQAPNVPENSLEAVEWAGRAGWESVEVDVRLTSDGTPILSHDQSWGREWCGLSGGLAGVPFNPFSPNTGTNAQANAVVSATSLSNTRSLLGQTWLRDTVSLIHSTTCGDYGLFRGEYPPTLEQVYDDMKQKNIQAVLIIDVQSPAAALAAWKVTQAKTDTQNRPMYETTIYKLPAAMFPNGPGDFRSTFQTNYANLQWIPVITSRLVAPANVAATLPDGEDGGFDVTSLTGAGFGGEAAINTWIDTMLSTSSAGIIDGIEVVMKEDFGILSSVLNHVGSIKNQFGFPMTIGNFNPIGEYYPNGTNQEPQFFRSTDATCCDYLEAYLYNDPNSKNGVVDPGGPKDNFDNRRFLTFIFRTGVPQTNFATTDDPYHVAQFLGSAQRNWRGHLVRDGASVANNAVVLSLDGSQSTANIGDTVHLLAGLSDQFATGTVTFMEGSTPLATVPGSSQSAALDVQETTAGSHNYTATYSGDSTFSATQSNSFQVTVTAATGGGSGTPPPPQQPQPPATPDAGEFLNHRALLGNVDADTAWFLSNIPFLEVPDPQIQQVYYYRWHTYKEHLVPVPGSGWVSTEFLGAPGYAAPYGGISAAAGHQIVEGRWLRDQQYVRGVTEYWLNGPGQSYKAQNDTVNPDTSDWAHEYSFWAGSAVWQTFLATGDAPFTTSLLAPLVKQYRGWDNHFNSQSSLYWQIPVWDATEYTPASYESSDPYHGGAGYRPTINSYQFGDAQAISRIAAIAGNSAYQSEYAGRASALQTAMHQYLWDPNRSFYYHMNRDNNPSNTLLDTREEQGFVPWMFGAALPSDASAMGQLLDPAGFSTAYGPPTAEKRSRWYMYEASTGCCHWDGPSWPFETSQTLTGLANLLIDYPAQSTVNANDYVNLLHTYANTQFNNGVPYVGQAHDPDNNNWIYEGTDYNHSSYVDNVISGFIGLRGQPDNSLVISPLAPPSWDYFALEDTPYHGHNITVLWDRLGTRYGQGAGLSVFVDGTNTVHQATLTPVKVDVGAPILQPFTPYNTLPASNGVYHILNVETGKLMGVEHEYPFDGAQIQQYEDNGSPDHAWAVEDAGAGNVKFRNIASNLVLGVDGESTADSALIKQAHDNGTADHAWQLVIAANGAYQIKNGNSGLLLGVSGESSANSANIVQFHDNGTRDHLWMLVPVQDPRNSVVYKIVNVNSAKDLAVENGSLADGAQIQQFRDTGTPDQLWAFEDTGTHIYKVRNVFSKLVLGIDGESTVDSALIKQAVDNGTNDHLWTSVDPSNSSPQLIQSNYSGLVLGVDGESKADSANVVQFHNTGTPDHLWTVVPNFDPRMKPFYQIVNVESGKLLGIENESFDDSAQVQQYEDNGSKDHVWQLENDGYNLYRIRSYYSNNVLGVDGESKADNALIKAAVENGTPDHVWQFIDTGGGQFQIKNMNSGLLLGVSGESSANGANIVQFHDNGTLDHLWKVIVAPTN